MENNLLSKKHVCFGSMALFAFFISTIETIASEYKPRWSELPCQICIERPEEQGIINIREVRLIVDDKQAMILAGGQAACAYVEPGDHFVYAVSPNPYDPNLKDAQAWKSNKMNFTLGTGKIAEFEVTKGMNEKEKQWLVKPAGTP